MKNNITVAITLILAFLAALYLGTAVAAGNLVELSGWFGVTLLILFLIKGYQFSWQVVLFIAWGNISFLHSFRIEPIHASSVIFVLFLFSALMRKSRLPIKVSLRPAGIVGLNVSIVVFVLYGMIHLVISRLFPHISGEFNFGNSAKAYFKTFFPLVILLFGMNSQIGFQVRKGWGRVFLVLMTVAVVGNVSYLLYLYVNGFSGTSETASFEEIGIVHIPLINAVPHHFAMRTLGPLAVLFGFGFISIPGWWREQPLIIKLIALALICGGLGGAVMSGGRAAVAMCLFFMGFIALYRKKVILIVMAAMGGVLLLVIVNLFSDTINRKAPLFVARPLQYLLIEKGRSMDSIKSSQNQRSALFDAAIDEWRSDPRITLIGRGVYRYANTADDLKPVLGEIGAFVEVNLRAGTCHSLIPSALIQYGIVGFMLFLLIWLFLLRFNWKIYKILRRDGYSMELQTITICLLLYNCLRIIIDLVASGWMTIFTITMLILIRSCMSYELSEYFMSEKAKNEALRTRQLAGNARGEGIPNVPASASR